MYVMKCTWLQCKNRRVCGRGIGSVARWRRALPSIFPSTQDSGCECYCPTRNHNHLHDIRTHFRLQPIDLNV